MTLDRTGATRYVTNSEIQTHKRCKRKWWLAYWLKLRLQAPAVAGVRGLGTRLHQALAARYTPGGTEETAWAALEDAYHADWDVLEERLDAEGLAELQKDHDLARIMLEGYFEWVAEEGVDVGLDIYASEAEVSGPLIGHDGNVRLLGRLDVQAHREIDGARFFIDHKSVGNFSQATKMLHMDEQMLTYNLLQVLTQLEQGAAFEDIVRCDGGIYNMLRRVKRTSRAKPPFYHREEVRFNRARLRNHYLHVRGAYGDIASSEMSLSLGDSHQEACPPSPRADCSWSCDYFALCPMFDDGSRAEDFISAYLVSYDPLDRYVESDRGLTEGEGETQ